MQTRSSITASRSPAPAAAPVRAVPADVITARTGADSRRARTPLFTRHMRGAIEAERDDRRQRRRDAHGPVRYRSRAATSHGPDRRRSRAATGDGLVHPRPLEAANGNGRAVTQARPDLDRWTDEGGSYDRETVAERRAPRVGSASRGRSPAGPARREST